MWNFFKRFRKPPAEPFVEDFEAYRESLESRAPRSEATALLEAPLLEAGDATIQLLLRDLDQEVLAKALAGASDAVRKRIFNAMANRGGAMLREDIEHYSSLNDADVAGHQRTLLDSLRPRQTEE